jgi:hypothetical protein
MKAITAAHKKQLEQITSDLEEQGGEVHSASLYYNEQIYHYNELLQKASDLRDQIISDQETYYEEKDEEWQEDDRGEAYQEWSDEWGGADLEAVEEIDEFEVEHPQTLSDLPHKPNEVQ